ncbi:DUF397 domain-containing protein [Streptomyces sp. FT05W]|uniref:DUF397 domain-containing protein n=1 Tax=Streptomyces TaxID=1883 RepID=UPI000BC557C8|nr:MULTISPECIES: DUF397 domain-containing protein [unclassified Streptomyces]RAS28941.1 uncharacterized protein DUF397 [Streptomyces avidinii]SNX78664.1 protein of unknown function [Streptomyces microflavus]MDX3180191.1 DUF397 domain-containing protein [Streptomyces sp. ME02-7008A-1]MDX3300932.1 DUF397 domain-containing protein [Streptomyces sp. ME02-7008A]PWS45942.1 DUF397 domain-containing protein [Streptomyces sp. FT05W]
MTIHHTRLATLDLTWSKSSYSTGNGGECVEFATEAAHVHIRDSKHPDGPVLTIGPSAWTGFVGLVAG